MLENVRFPEWVIAAEVFAGDGGYRNRSMFAHVVQYGHFSVRSSLIISGNAKDEFVCGIERWESYPGDAVVATAVKALDQWCLRCWYKRAKELNGAQALSIVAV